MPSSTSSRTRTSVHSGGHHRSATRPNPAIWPGRGAELRADQREFRSVRWYNSDEQLAWPSDLFDPRMTRYIRKLAAARPRDPLHVSSRTP